MNILVTVLTLIAFFVSSDAGPQGRISYGAIAGERQFPFHVGISKFSGENASLDCGGAIISNYWVITAAHCVENLTEVTLHIGSTNFYTPVLTFTISDNFITMHPDYNTNNLENDIALINTPYIGYTHKINRIKLPSMSVDVAHDLAHEIYTAIGWGEDQNRHHDPYHLRYNYFRVMTNDACHPYLIVDGFNNEKTICAMAEVGSTCYGDSGGPFFNPINNFLVGIFSFMVSLTCDLGYPIAFVRVTEYLDWIRLVSGVYRA